MAKNNNLTDFTTDIANAIRNKCKINGKINPQDFSEFVGGMPFFKFRETVDITSPATSGISLPLSYNTTYVKGYVYLTNDSGETEIPAEDGTAMVLTNGYSAEPLFTINSTSERVEISGYPWGLMFNYVSFISGSDGTGDALIDSGWHIKLDIYDLYIGNPNGKNTPIYLNRAEGGGIV